MSERKKNIFSDKKIVSRAIKDSFLKLNPRTQVKNPVMFMVFVSAILTLAMFGFALAGVRDAESRVHTCHISHPLVHRTVRQLCRGNRRRQGQGPGRCAEGRQKGYHGVQDTIPGPER